MLSRSAQSLYWLGRYLERAGNLARLLQLQSESLVDRPIREIHFGWNRIYKCIDREPPAGEVRLFGDEEFVLADSFALADDLTFERVNPCSVYSCFAQGRENARHTRHCISQEVWTCLNTAYLRLQQQNISTVWRWEPRAFYQSVATDIETFGGLAESTMYHDDRWSFLQLGRYVERVQGVTALLLAQADTTKASAFQEFHEEDWTSLLRVFYALEVYNLTYSVAILPEKVMDLLVNDPLLPESLGRTVKLIESEIAAIGSGPYSRSGRALQRSVGRLSATINFEWPDAEEPIVLLRDIFKGAEELHFLINEAYFDYPVQGPV